MQSVLLINPPFERLKGFNIESMSLGLLSMASVLDENGYTCHVYDADTSFELGNLRKDISGRPATQDNYVKNLENKEHPAWVELQQVVLKYQPKIVGITVKTPHYHSSLQTAILVRSLLPEAIIVVGGPHVTITGDTMLENEYIDFAFYGEAEYTFLAFAEAVFHDKDYSAIDGLIYKDGENIRQNRRPERIKDLDSLPFPNKELLVFSEQYRKKLGAIMTSRGCPFECAFCATVPLWGRATKFRSVENILSEIEFLHKKYNIKTFEIVDDTFTLRKKEVIRFCKGLIDRFGERYFNWVCLTNITVIDSELLKYLKRAGCFKINIGIESGSDRILKLIHKKTTTDMVRKAVKMIKRQGLQVHGYFMMGFPQETVDEMRQTISFIKEIRPDSINLCTFTPYPNTELYQLTVENGFLSEDET